MDITAPIPKATKAKQTIRMLFHKDEYSARSSEIKVLGVNWNIYVTTWDGFTITIERSSNPKDSPCIITYEIRLIGECGDCISRRQGFSQDNGWKCYPFKKNKEFIACLKSQSFFNAYGNMTIEFDMSVSEQAEDLCAKNYNLFLENSPFAPDFAILVEGRSIYVNKKFLSIHSTYFKAMFESHFKESVLDEIEIEDLDFNEFIELLSIVYPVGEFISVSNVECVLKLADRFDMPGVLRQCEQFLILESNIKNVKKLILAQRYSLIGLQENCASQFQRFNDIKELKDSEEYVHLNERTKSIMLDSLASSNSKES